MVQTSEERKYTILLNILDRTIQDGVVSGRRAIYRDASTSQESRDAARARAFIHLFLEATYGLYDFDEREKLITDGTYDGGIDAYYIDYHQKEVVLVQSKFRTTPENFQAKTITIEDITRIDAERIVRGETEDEMGNPYNGHVRAFQNKLREVADIAEYNFRIVLLANVRKGDHMAFSRLFSGYNTEVLDFELCYGLLVLPVVRGEQAYFPDLIFEIDMSTKSAGSHLEGMVATAYGPAKVTVILAPTLEIAQFMSRYRNSILRYNPRSYLELSGQTTNKGIRSSILDKKSGEFALLNNGITIISDRAFVTDKTGQKGQARVQLRNPQIINGGQTAFTLSRIYEDSSDIDRAILFEDKEVVVRIISLSEIPEQDRAPLIKEISAATNSQTQVNTADRVVTTEAQRLMAEKIFQTHGVLYEHKRGEYAEAVHAGFVNRRSIIDRAMFLRLMLLGAGDYARSVSNKAVKRGKGFEQLDVSEKSVIRFGEVFQLYQALRGFLKGEEGGRLAELMAVLQLALSIADQKFLGEDVPIADVATATRELWPVLIDWVTLRRPQRVLKVPGSSRKVFYPITSYDWAKSAAVPKDIERFLKLVEVRDGKADASEVRRKLAEQRSNAPHSLVPSSGPSNLREVFGSLFTEDRES